MNEEQPLRQGKVLTAPLFNKPMRVKTVRADGSDIWVVGLVGTLADDAGAGKAIMAAGRHRYMFVPVRAG